MPLNSQPIFVLILIFCSACSETPLSKEEQIRQFIETGVNAAEDRNHSELEEMIDPGYRDAKALTRKQLVSMIKLYFFRHKNIFLFTKIRDISFPGEDQALVGLHVAMAGSVISDASALANLRARVYYFDLDLVNRDGWRLREASWKPASLADMQ